MYGRPIGMQWVAHYMIGTQILIDATEIILILLNRLFNFKFDQCTCLSINSDVAGWRIREYALKRNPNDEWDLRILVYKPNELKFTRPM